ncbi:cryptochrome/photolyase family protein [Flavobacterium pallidum]|uniref:Cryptochrome/photolyase family protein n=1 Tax=Flavobacterium pallidum TaxID=2172098 RepID=A0A2S1SK33_9FLAO|nr:cryptochrome/photolyase family protein [Flavobacterium pallidum]AWI26768.1 cryptochrome/photolyase family protein [Flavobacterium pallidum]
MPQKLRLILGDQLNYEHSWFRSLDDCTTYLMMEIRSETDYTTHHIQKITAFFFAMRNFADWLKTAGHNVIYIKLGDAGNQQTFEANILKVIAEKEICHFEYQLPDEYRIDIALRNFCKSLAITSDSADTEHFYTTREELADFFKGKTQYVMETFYRAMRKKNNILVFDSQPVGGQWNFDSDNRKKLPKGHTPPKPLVFDKDVSGIVSEIQKNDISTMGTVDAHHFIWPTTRTESLQLLNYFTENCLPLFGSFQDAMAPGEWSIYHSRLSFSMNTKMISPSEVVDAAITEWQKRPDEIELHQLEGFVRQILGWREYMRGIYWMKMPEFSQLNYFSHSNNLPEWFWTGKTKMHCLREAITQSLTYSYAHHIQRLMITGNFALLAGVDPDQVDDWYLGIYIDAIEWVEITNTRGMSQFADGGIIGTKPYVSSATYIDKMSHYCGTCFYDKSKRTGPGACPFNSLYWNFYDTNKEKLSKNTRVSMVYKIWDKMKPQEKVALIEQAQYYLKNVNLL